ncbi:MAG: histidine-type phosphatase [Elusimicrobiaceae bacterium]|nr:histidine-type phosphatase [Elusimicrobiaceae bacterium]
MLKKGFIAVVVSLLLGSVFTYAQQPLQHQDQYTLKQVLVLSRHNIRSPLSGYGSALARLTPHSWFNWSSGPSELSLLGGELETLMGQYFRKWLVSQGLITENYIPRSGEVLFYANSMQRTIATAQYFSSGMLPVANVRIKHKYAPSRMDPVFEPRLIFVSDQFRALALQQIAAMGGEKGLQGIGEQVAQEMALLEKVLDLSKSDMVKNNELTHFGTNDTEIILNLHKEPAMRGSLKLAEKASDALILQYYEEPNPRTAAFGRTLTEKQWDQIARIKDFYGDVLFTAPAIAVNVAHPLLKVMHKELKNNKRKFTFLCGHDSNLASVLTALEVEPYSVPNSIQKTTPIGSKVLFNKWLGKDGKEYVSINLVYQTTDQLRQRSMLSLDTPPAVFPLHLQGLTPNEDGLYTLAEVQQRFEKAIKAYKTLKKQYK